MVLLRFVGAQCCSFFLARDGVWRPYHGSDREATLGQTLAREPLGFPRPRSVLRQLDLRLLGVTPVEQERPAEQLDELGARRRRDLLGEVAALVGALGPDADLDELVLLERLVDGGAASQSGSCGSLPRFSLDARSTRGTSASANEQAMPDRGPIGEVVTIVVVTIVFTEVIIEAFAIAVGVTVTATIAAGAAEAFAKRGRKPKKLSCSDHLGNCLMSELADQPGTGPDHSLCHDCWMRCEKGHWPKHVDQASRGRVSCWYGPEADY